MNLSLQCHSHFSSTLPTELSLVSALQNSLKVIPSRQEMEAKIQKEGITEQPSKILCKDVTTLAEFDLENLRLAFHFARERYSMYVQKEVQKKTHPWTNDPILDSYR